MRSKPWDMKYTDLCKYIDEKNYYRDTGDSKGIPIGLKELTPEEKDNVYTYLYNLVYALSKKKRLFTKKSDYDEFCLQAAGDFYMRLRKPDQDYTYQSRNNKPIKSILNYVKGALGFMSISWKNGNYAEMLNPDFNEMEELEGAKKYLYNIAEDQFTEDKIQVYEEVINNLPKYLTDSLNKGLFKKNKLKNYQVLLSEYITLCNCLTIENKKSGYNPDKVQLKLFDQLKNRDKFITVFSDDPLITKDLVDLQLKKGFFLMEDDLNELMEGSKPSDEELDNILASAFPTYDTDQSEDF